MSGSKKLQITIKLCEVEGINGIYSNDVFPSEEHKLSLSNFLTKAMHNITDDKKYTAPSNFIFIHETFHDANSVHNYILFLHQSTTNMLKSKWFIAGYKKAEQTIELLYFNIDRISSIYCLPPCMQWKLYNNNNKEHSRTDIHINTFDPKAINLDYPLVVMLHPIPRRYDREWKQYKRKYDGRYSNAFYEQHFDNIYDASIKYKAIDDVRWFSNAHSWYKHLPINGEKYRIYPDYNAMTRGYSPGTRHERQIRWSMSGYDRMYFDKLEFTDEMAHIINKYGTIYFNRAFCGINRSNVYGDSEYGRERYPKSQIYKDSAQFTKEESEQQIENAVRCAFKIHDEILKVFDAKKHFVYNHWMRVNGVKYVMKGIQDIIIRYIFLEFEQYAFKQVPVYQWDRYKTNRYFRRLYGGTASQTEDMKLIDGVFDKYVIDGVHLLQVGSLNMEEVEGLLAMKKRILNEIDGLYDGLELGKFVEHQVKYKYIYIENERVREIENKDELHKLKNVSFFEFQRNGGNDNAAFYNKLNISDAKVIGICQQIHSKCCNSIQLSKDSYW